MIPSKTPRDNVVEKDETSASPALPSNKSWASPPNVDFEEVAMYTLRHPCNLLEIAIETCFLACSYYLKDMESVRLLREPCHCIQAVVCFHYSGWLTGREPMKFTFPVLSDEVEAEDAWLPDACPPDLSSKPQFIIENNAGGLSRRRYLCWSHAIGKRPPSHPSLALGVINRDHHCIGFLVPTGEVQCVIASARTRLHVCNSILECAWQGREDSCVPGQRIADDDDWLGRKAHPEPLLTLKSEALCFYNLFMVLLRLTASDAEQPSCSSKDVFYIAREEIEFRHW
ncbi:hypothetical protein M758_5G190300 [Ceratodon purpureus]|nr:hypothetical protein M758_5G190300 [Ceratodon purpureus]